MIFQRLVLFGRQYTARVFDNTRTLFDWIEGVESQTCARPFDLEVASCHIVFASAFFLGARHCLRFCKALIAADRGNTTVRAAQEIARRLFKSSEGDPTNVTDGAISDAFDRLDREGYAGLRVVGFGGGEKEESHPKVAPDHGWLSSRATALARPCIQ